MIGDVLTQPSIRRAFNHYEYHLMINESVSTGGRLVSLCMIALGAASLCGCVDAPRDDRNAGPGGIMFDFTGQSVAFKGHPSDAKDSASAGTTDPIYIDESKLNVTLRNYGMRFI